jgi:hypothetical protein
LRVPLGAELREVIQQKSHRGNARVTYVEGVKLLDRSVTGVQHPFYGRNGADIERGRSVTNT